MDGDGPGARSINFRPSTPCKEGAAVGRLCRPRRCPQGAAAGTAPSPTPMRRWSRRRVCVRSRAGCLAGYALGVSDAMLRGAAPAGCRTWAGGRRVVRARVQKRPGLDPVLLAHPDRLCALSCRCRALATRVLPGRASAGATRGAVADGRRALAAWGQKMPTMDPEPLVQADRARAHGGRCRVPATSRVHRTPAAGRSRVAAAACVTAAAVAHARTVSNPGLFVPTVNRGVEL